MGILLRRPRAKDDAAVNELIGTILLMAIAVGLVGAFILVLFSIPGPSPSTHTQLQAFIVPTAADTLVLEHRGGPAIPISQLVASVTVNGTSTRWAVGDNLAPGGPWTIRSASGQTKTTGSFAVGDQASYQSVTLYKAATRVMVVDNDEGALALGATTVRDADTAAPTFASSRTTGRTTVQVNFTEALRTIAASDFRVGGNTPSLAVLLGNGSAAELTVASFATDATPQVTSIAIPLSTVDAAGNAFAGSAASTPIDGVAPEILTGPSAAPTTSSATVVWTTGEAGTTIVRFGPTPSDLGLSQSGASATSHSVALVGLTDNFRYYYTVSVTDAAGNTVTSAAGNFVTTALASSGGGGNGDAVQWHFVLNRTFTPVTSGTPSDAVQTFRVAIRNATDAIQTTNSAVTVTLSSNSSVGYFLDTAGTSIIQELTIAGGSSYADFRYVDFRDGGYSVLGATSANITPVFTTVQVAGGTGYGIPYRLEFSTQDTSQASGTATSNLIVSLRDASNNLVQAPYTVVVNLSTNSTSGYFQNGAGPIAAINIPATSSSSAAFTYVDNRPAGTTSMLMASAQGILPTTMPVAMSGTTSSVLGVGNRLEFTAVPTGLTSGTPSATDYVVTLKDQGGRAIVPDSTVNVRLVSNSSFAYFLDTDGTTLVTSRNLTATNGTAWFKYVDFRSNGTSILIASANGTLAASANVSVTGRSVAGLPDHMVWSTAPTSVASGTVAGPFQLQLRDAWNNQVTAPAQRTVTLSTNSTQGVFCSDAGCATRIITVNFSAGGALSDQFYYRDQRFSAMSVLVASTPKVTSAMSVISVIGGTPQDDYLAWTTAPTSMTAGSIAGPYVLTLRDESGQARTTASAIEATLLTNSTYGVFCSDAACAALRTSINVTAGGSTTPNFYYRDARASSIAVLTAFAPRTTPSSVIVAVTGGSNLSAASASTAVPHHLGFTTSNTTLNPGINSSTWTVKLFDANGTLFNALASITVNLSSSSPEAEFIHDSTGAPIQSVTISGGANSATFRYRDNWTVGGRFSIMASADNVIPATAPIFIYNRGIGAMQGDSESSVRAQLGFATEETDATNHTMTLAIVNPTPTNKVVTQVGFTVNPTALGQFASNVFMSTGRDGWFAACGWTRTGTTNVTCNMADFAIPPYSMAQVALSYATPTTGSDTSAILNATVYMLNLSVQDSVNIRQETTAGNGGDADFFPTDTLNGNAIGGIQNLTAGAKRTLFFRMDSIQDTIGFQARIEIPPGWLVEPANENTGATIAVERPTHSRPGRVTFGGSSIGDANIAIDVWPPADMTGVALLYTEFLIQGPGGQDFQSQLNAFPITVVPP